MYSVIGQSEINGSDDFITCQSNHTTSFAVLMQFNERPIPAVHDRVMDSMTKAFTAVSIVSLFITISIFLMFETLRNSERYQIHIHLAASLMVALCLFLIGMEMTNNKIVCTVIAMLLHFLFLSVFGWMMVEGINLYFKIVKVYGSEKNRMPLYIGIGYGIPAAIVIISGALKFDNYTSPTSCWLDVQSGLIWAFGAPAIAVILINSVLLLLIGRIIFKAVVGTKADGTRASLKGTLILTPLLGITWVFGYMSLTGAAIVFQYLFVICNSLQGFFIFMAYCALSKEVQNHIKTAVDRHRNQVEPRTNTLMTEDTKLADVKSKYPTN
ncbi:adhesion G-protein coupled receptor D1-like [Amphiura filiformis]|uniref:adhesion G-protein coupled receptor D1-like n=1 Tax=Amphiura filiformis TaxID=82378 RepID=UPI003B21FF8D